MDFEVASRQVPEVDLIAIFLGFWEGTAMFSNGALWLMSVQSTLSRWSAL